MIFTIALESLVGSNKVKKKSVSVYVCFYVFPCKFAIDWKEMTPMFYLDQCLFSTLGM